MKKLTSADLKSFRDLLDIPVTDAQIDADPYLVPYYKPGAGAEELQYLFERRRELGGFVPQRRNQPRPVPLPGPQAYEGLRKGSGKQMAATTMVFVRLLRDLMRDKTFGPRIVPIVPGRGPHVRDGLVLPDREDLQPPRTAVHRGGPGVAVGLQGVSPGADPAHRDQRGGIDGGVHRCRHRLRHTRRADDPGVRLLLHVRISTHRRRDVGRDGSDDPRVHHRRHRRTHHIDR